MSVRLYVHPSRIRFRAITLLFVVGLKYCLAHMIAIIGLRVACKIPVGTFNDKVT